MVHKKYVFIDTRLQKVFTSLDKALKSKIEALTHVLESEGRLAEPYGKKISADLYEIRIKYRGQWRVICAYIKKDTIVLLCIFQKKLKKHL
ncbi:MAG: type II toxin-antitoxin system RelE/ParE family toxin [Microgenomates group bacterium]